MTKRREDNEHVDVRYRRILPRASNEADPYGAPTRVIQLLIAPSQPNARRRPTTSSERGKAFRARRRIYKGQLEVQIQELQEALRRLDERKGLLQTRIFERRRSSTGSLERLVREYYSLFQHGMGNRRRAGVDPDYAARYAADIAHKENFFRCIMADDAITGDLKGPDAALMQWNTFSAAHVQMTVSIEHIEAFGDPNDPFIELHSTMHFICGPQTLLLLYPGSERNSDLVDQFDNRPVAFQVLTSFKFNDDGRICYEQVQTNLLDGYLRASISMDDITELFRYSIISPSLTVKEEVTLAQVGDDRSFLTKDDFQTRRNDSILDADQLFDRRGRADYDQDRSRRHWYIYEASS